MLKDTTVEQKAIIFAYDNNDYIPAEIIENTSRPYTAFFVGKTVINGLTFEEQLNCPELVSAIGIATSSPDFTEEQLSYWSDWKYDIPIGKYDNKTGKATYFTQIDAGYVIKDGVLRPNDLNDFILYRMMNVDPLVGKSEEDYAESVDQFDFFMIDLEKKKLAQLGKIDLKQKTTKALSAILDTKDSLSLIKQIFIVSKEYSFYDVYSLDETTASTELFSFADKKPELFLETYAKPDLVDRALVRELVEAGILTEVANQYYFGEEQIGNANAILTYLKSPGNKIAVEKMREKLKQNNLINAIS